MIKIKIMMMTMIMRLGQNKLCERNTETYEKKKIMIKLIINRK